RGSPVTVVPWLRAALRNYSWYVLSESPDRGGRRWISFSRQTGAARGAPPHLRRARSQLRSMEETHDNGAQGSFASVIIAVYEDWRTLARCLESLSLQVDAPSFEVVVVNDGSSSMMPREIREFSPRYSLRILSQPHSGTAAARNHGVRNSRGGILL